MRLCLRCPTAALRLTPTGERLSTTWRPLIDTQIALLERMRDRLDGCIGCGCLSLKLCQLLNNDDAVGERGPGPRYLLDGD